MEIAFILIGYLIIGFIIAFVCNKISRKNKCKNLRPKEGVRTLFFWPIDFIYGFCWLICKIFEKLGFDGRTVK